MQSPPPIEKLIYELSYPAQPDAAPLYRLVRWHSNGCFIRTTTELRSIESKLTPGAADTLCGRNGDTYWTLQRFGPGSVLLTVWTNDGLVAEPPTAVYPTVMNSGGGIRFDHESLNRNPAYLAVMGAAMDLAPVLNLGISGAAIGQVSWNGNRLLCFDRERSIVREGELHCDKDGRASRLELVIHDLAEKRAKDVPSVVRWRIEYGYQDGEAPAGLPNEMSVFLLRSNEPPRALQRYRIHELRVARAALSQELLDPRPLLGDLGIRHAMVSNSTSFVLQSDGRWLPMWKPDDPRIYDPRRTNRWKTVYGLSATLLLLGAVAVLMRLRRKDTNQGERNRLNKV